MSTAHSDAWALVMAAGQGARMGGTPKQYRGLGGEALLRHCLRTLMEHDAIGSTRVVIAPEHGALYRSATADLAGLDAPVTGGPTRQHSVRAGLAACACAAETPDLVLIHDAARPFVSAAQIDLCLTALADAAIQGAAPARPVTDTLKRKAAGDWQTVPRGGLWRVQTPQVFRFAALRQAHEEAARTSTSTDTDTGTGTGTDTDDTTTAEAAGMRVRLVDGDPGNIKITTAADLRHAERLLAAAGAGDDIRTGSGYDAHRFAAGAGLTLCGVRVPHDRALAGHSDADVGLHALADALLGAMAAGDLGLHFPASDSRWQDADSALFVRHAVRLAAAAGKRVAHADITLICAAPAIAPHRNAMRSRVAALLDVPPGRVSIKATTTDGLGFTGRGEGIAAQAVVTLRGPHAGSAMTAP